MTELTWEGKYDKDGKRVAPLRITLPFQTVETVNESAQQRQQALSLFSSGHDQEWRNRLIWGDKKYVLPSLLNEFAGKVNLIYIDPPFNVGANFSYTATIPEAPEEDGDGTDFVKEPSMIEQKAYRDTWGRGLDSYLQWFYETAVLLRELLAENGSIYVHLDWHVGHYSKVILDEVFGRPNFVNEVIWRRSFGHSDSDRYGNIHDALLFYGKSEQHTWNQLLFPADKEYIDTFFDQFDPERKERFQRLSLSAGGLSGGGYDYEYKGVRTLWRCPIETLKKHDAEGRLHWPKKKGGVPRLKKYESEHKGVPLYDIWTDISKIHNQSEELVGYPTQKPESLLQRIIKSSSNENDLVLDCFCGSGTTVAVAEKLNRRWVTCDLGRFAIHTARKRLLSIPNVKPFAVQNLGKYERQAWLTAEFGAEAQARTGAYRKFILDLYNARPVTSMVWLHGIKAGRMVHIGSVDSPVSVGDVTGMVTEFKKSQGKGKDAPSTNGIDVLGWDFAFELNEVARQQAAQANVNVRFIRIPRELMEKKAVEQGDIKFFELAALSVDMKKSKRAVTLTLTDFTIPPDDVPPEVQQAIKHWSQWIDYWAVDWNNKGDNFHNEWQSYRTRQSSELQKTVAHDYDAPGEYLICVKVIDILGNDTTKTLTVKVV